MGETAKWLCNGHRYRKVWRTGAIFVIQSTIVPRGRAFIEGNAMGIEERDEQSLGSREMFGGPKGHTVQ